MIWQHRLSVDWKRLFPKGTVPIEKIEESLCPEYKQYKHHLTDRLKRIAKLADIMEAMKFIRSEGKGGVSQAYFSGAPKNLQSSGQRFQGAIPRTGIGRPLKCLLDELLNGNPTMIDFVDAFQ